MNVRKSIFASLGLLLTLGSLYSVNQHQVNTPTASQVADGGAPLPPIPKGKGTLYADGGAPLPPIPKATGKLYVA
jgi:hypothetical protein